MEHVVSRSTAGRIAALLCLVSGAVTLLSVVLPAPPTLNAGAVALVGAVAMLAAVPAWFLPWHRWPRRAGLVVPLTCGGHSAQPLLRQPDAAMYQAKQAGKGRTVLLELSAAA